MNLTSDIRLHVDAGRRGSGVEPDGGDDGARLGGDLHHHRQGPQGDACALVLQKFHLKV